MKNKILAAFSCLAMIAGLGACGNNSSAASSAASSTKTSSVASSTPASSVVSSVASVTHTLTLSLTGTAKVGQTLNIITKFDGSIVTDAAIAITKGADLVTLDSAAGTIKCNAAGDLVVKATYQGLETTQSVTIASDEIVVTTIKTIQDTAGTYSGTTASYPSQITIQGIVLNVNKNGIVVYDGTASIVVYDKDLITTYKLGDYVQVTGTPTRYKSGTDERWWQFSYSDTGLSAKIYTPAAPIALPTSGKATWDVTTITNYTTPAAGQLQYMEATVKLVDDGSHVNMYIGDYTAKSLSYYYSGTAITYTSGLKYKVTGYTAECQQGKYVVCYVAGLEAVAMDPVTSVTIKEGATGTVGKDDYLQLTATVAPSTANPNVTWSVETGKEAILSVDANGKVKGLAEGTAVVTATSVGTDASNAAVTASITITVTAPVAKALPLACTINKAIPDGWTFESKYSAEYYGDGGLKLTSPTANASITSPLFTENSAGVDVAVVIGALNKNTKTAAGGDHVFTVTGLDASGAAVSGAVAYIDAVEANKTSAVVTVTGTGVVKIKVAFTAYPTASSAFYNVSFKGYTLAAHVAA